MINPSLDEGLQLVPRQDALASEIPDNDLLALELHPICIAAPDLRGAFVARAAKKLKDRSAS